MEIINRFKEVLMLGMLLISLVLYGYNVHYRKEIDRLNTIIVEQEVLNKQALAKIEKDFNNTTNKLTTIKKVYIPINKYIVEYKGESNDSCKNASDLSNSIIY